MSAKAWAVPVVLAALATAYAVVSGVAADDLGLSLVAVGAPVVIIAAVWVLTLWSLNRYGAVTLTRETLTVGRDTVPVPSIDRAWVQMLADRAAPGHRERLATSAGTFTVAPDAQLELNRGRLLGGAKGSTLGDDLVTLQLTNGSRVSAPTKDRVGLLGGLFTALEDP